MLTVLAGCVGNFEMKQTEPFRVQIDGDAQESRVAAPDSDSKEAADEPETSEFKLDSAENVQIVKVKVEVVNVDMDDDDEGDDDGTTTASPTDDETDNDSEPAIILIIIEDRDTGERLNEQQVEADDQTANVELNVDVKGRDNVVVITQAIQGVADVSVAAEADMETSPDDGMTTSAAPTTTYG